MPAKKATTTEPKETKAVETSVKSVAELRAEYAKYALEFKMNKTKDSSKLKKMRKEIARALTKQNTK